MKAVARGFTLIELLVVVAIIGILAAIAAFNMRIARTKAMVAKAQADMRTITDVLFAYKLDNEEFPPGQRRADGSLPMYLSGAITTPIAYISSVLLEDAFLTKDPADLKVINNKDSRDFKLLRRYRYINVHEHYSPQARRISSTNTAANFKAYHEEFGGFILTSNGPDHYYNYQRKEAGFMGRPFNFTRPYDPSNGVISVGNIIRSERYPTDQHQYRFIGRR